MSRTYMYTLSYYNFAKQTEHRQICPQVKPTLAGKSKQQQHSTSESVIIFEIALARIVCSRHNGQRTNILPSCEMVELFPIILLN